MAEALPHPTAISRPKPEVQRDFISVEQTRCPDPVWHFKLGLPHGCKVGPQGKDVPTSAEPQSLGLFHRDEPPVDIEVIGVVAEREIDPADYLDCFLEIEKKTVESRRSVPMRGGIVGDAVATWTVDEKPFIGRFFCTKWGPRIFILCFRTPAEHYERLAEDFFISIATFSVKDDSLGLFAEKVHTVSNTVPVPWRVIVPESWIIQPEPNASDVAGSFQATQVPPLQTTELQVLFGKLSFAVAARSEAKGGRGAAQAYISAVRDVGVVLEHEEFVEEPAADPFQKSWLLVTPVTKGGHPGELRCRVLMHRQAWVIAGVLGPTREESALAWMQNKRTLDIVTSTLKIKS